MGSTGGIGHPELFVRRSTLFPRTPPALVTSQPTIRRKSVGVIDAPDEVARITLAPRQRRIQGPFFVLLMHTKPFRKCAVPSHFKNTQAAAGIEWQPTAGPKKKCYAHGRRSVAPGRARYT